MIIVAIDEININKASFILDNLDPEKCMVKIGSVSFNSIGHKIIYYAAEKGFDIFLDLKFHDIPIHISGGKEMMIAAMQAVRETDIKVFGVTALTSLSDIDTKQIYQRNAADQVNAMLDIAEETKIDGVVCSPHELNLVTLRDSLLSITPGIRLSDLNDDQTRVMTPKQAIDLGSNYIVIGRPITYAEDISEALNTIYQIIN